MIGTTLQNRYRVDAELGRGGMGTVYRAHDMLLDRDVAIKVLSGAGGQGGLDAEGRARLLREAQAAARLNHPHIVAVHDVGGADLAGASGTAQLVPFIVMELVDGQSLHAQRPQALGEILSLARQMCAALEHAHTHGVIHRDLKPENILVTAEGQAKLMDFGLARSLASRLSTDGGLIGTVFYIAPEQALGRPVDGRADLYALGVILYELTTGQLPFQADDPLAIITQHLHTPVTPPRAHNPGLPPALDTLIFQLLSKKPEERPASAGEVGRILEILENLERIEPRRAAPAAPEAEGLAPLDWLVQGKLVGRERELAEAQRIWRRALAGDGQVLLISGEPGIGKTRFARELTAQAQAAGGQVVAAECYAEGGPPYSPIAQLIRGSVSDGLALPDLVLNDLITLSPDLRARYPLAPNSPLEPQAEQQRIFESVVALFNALAARAPVVLMVDDVHWADSSSLALLRHLARRARRLPLLMVLTYREVDVAEGHPLAGVLLDLNRERLAARLKLARLSREQTGDLLSALFAEETTPEFLDGIYQETEGLPFFVEEVCKALVEDGKLYREGGRWRRPAMDELYIPQSVRAAIQARVGKLPEPAQDALRFAAVFGREFDFDTLRQASEGPEELLIEALERAEQAQLVAEVKRAGRTAFAFAHALIPSTLRESMSSLRRQRLHRRVASVVENLRPDDYAVLAYHFGEAGDAERARACSARAGERALDVYANEEAERHFRRALELGAPEAERARLLSGLGQALAWQSRFQQAIAAWREAIGLYRAMGDADNVARYYARSARMAWFDGDPPGSLSICREGMQALGLDPESPDAQPEAAAGSPGLADLIHETARAYYFTGRAAQARPLCERALAMAERLGDAAVQAEALTTLGLLLTQDDHAAACAAFERAIQLAEASGRMFTAARAHNNLGLSLAYMGRFDEALRHYEQAAESTRRMGSAAGEVFYRSAIAHTLIELSDYPKAEEILARLREVVSRIPEPAPQVLQLRGVEATLLHRRGERQEAIRRLQELEVEMGRLGELQGRTITLNSLAQIHIELEEWAQAEWALEQVLALDGDGLGDVVLSNCLLSAVRANQGRFGEARRLLAEARGRATPQPNNLDQMQLALAEARLARAEQRWPEALAAFDEAAAILARAGVRWSRAQVLCEWAAAHQARGAPGDVEAARLRLHEAVEIYETIGVPNYADVARRQLAELPA